MDLSEKLDAGDAVKPLATARLRLRAPRMADADWLALHLSDAETAAALTSIPHPFRRHHAFLWITRPRTPGVARIIETDDGPVGAVSIDPDLAYWLSPAARGKGLAREAAAALVDWHMAAGAAKIASAVVPGNGASLRILQSLGFRPGAKATRRCHVRRGAVAVQSLTLSQADWAARRRLPYLRSPRLEMRPLQHSDAARLSEIAARPEVARMVYWVTIPWPEAEVRAYIDRFAWTGRPGFKLAICLGGQLVGTIGLSVLGGEAEVAYFLAPEMWGRGLAAEALHAFLPACFNTFDLPAVLADVYDDNAGSARLVQRLGFVPVRHGHAPTHGRPEHDPHTVYRLSRDVFEARR